MKTLFKILFVLSLSGNAFGQQGLGYFVGIYKTKDINDAKSIAARTYEKSKIIKWYDENLWIVALGPTTLEHAKELEADIANKTNTKGNTQIIKFPNSYLRWDAEVLNASAQVLDGDGPSIETQKKVVSSNSNDIKTFNESGWIEIRSGEVESNPQVKFNMYLRLESGYSKYRLLSHLTNWSQKLNDGTMSRMNKILINCEVGKYSFTETYLYSEADSRGEINKKETSTAVYEIAKSDNANFYRDACDRKLIKEDIIVKKEWDKLLTDIKIQEKIAQQVMENMRKHEDQQRKQSNMADSSCKPAIENRFNTFGKNRYGVLAGRKVVKINRVITYDSKMTSRMGKGNNILSIYNVLTDDYRDGRQLQGSLLTVNCVVSSGGEVLGLEVDYR